MTQSPVFIINFNRLILPSRMADYLADCPDVYPVIVDNGSTYPPLLEYYKTTPHKVELLGGNWGPTVIWFSGILDRYDIHERFILTDSDLDISGVPKDFLHLLHLGLDRYSWAQKSGLSIEINDIPNTEIGKAAKNHEKNYWADKLDNQFYRAQIDTTFCLVRKIHDLPAVRTARPYTARHIPWYYKTLAEVPEDELFYMKTCLPRCNYWAKRIAAKFGVETIPNQ